METWNWCCLPDFASVCPYGTAQLSRVTAIVVWRSVLAAGDCPCRQWLAYHPAGRDLQAVVAEAEASFPLTVPVPWLPRPSCASRAHSSWWSLLCPQTRMSLRRVANALHRLSRPQRHRPCHDLTFAGDGCIEQSVQSVVETRCLVLKDTSSRHRRVRATACEVRPPRNLPRLKQPPTNQRTQGVSFGHRTGYQHNSSHASSYWAMR
jgi:hypothetical protein